MLLTHHSAEDGISQNHASSNSKDLQNESGKLNLLQPLSIQVLQEIGRRCNSKVAWLLHLTDNFCLFFMNCINMFFLYRLSLSPF